jgi:hypothetical protein
MSELDDVLASNRDSLQRLIALAEKCEPVWMVPRAPGKWSPSQLVEHVARALDESAVLVEGGVPKFPKLPRFLRPVVRRFLFQRALVKDGFPKARTSRPFDPIEGPATPAAAKARLEGALANLERVCRAKGGNHSIESHTFGVVSVLDWARFQGVHVRHHTKQLPGT